MEGGSYVFWRRKVEGFGIRLFLWDSRDVGRYVCFFFFSFWLYCFMEFGNFRSVLFFGFGC